MDEPVEGPDTSLPAVPAPGFPRASGGRSTRGVLLPDQRSNRFDRHQHDAFPEGTGNEPAAPIEFDCAIIDCVDDDASDTGYFGCCKASSERVSQERRPDTETLPPGIDGKTSDEQQWHLLGHAAAKSCRREQAALLNSRRDGKITDHSNRLVRRAGDVGSCGKTFARSGALAQPPVERWMRAVCELRKIVFGSQSFRRAKRRWCGNHASHGAFRFSLARAPAGGSGGESSNARKRAWASSSKKNAR